MAEKYYIFDCGCKYPAPSTVGDKYARCPIHKDGRLVNLEIICIDCGKKEICHKLAHLRERCVDCSKKASRELDKRNRKKAMPKKKGKNIKVCRKCGHSLCNVNRLIGICFACQHGAFFDEKPEGYVLHDA